MVAKYADQLPLYRQETIFGRASLAIPRSTLGAWVGAFGGVRLRPFIDALKEAILDHMFCMPTKRRGRCSNLAPARRTALTCGPTPQAPSKA